MGIYSDAERTHVLRDHIGTMDVGVFDTTFNHRLSRFAKDVGGGVALAAPKFAFDVARPGVYAVNTLGNIPEDEQLNVRNLLSMMGQDIPPEEIGNSFWDLVSSGDRAVKENIAGSTKFTADALPMVTTVAGVQKGLTSALLNPGALLSRSATVGKISNYLQGVGALGKYGIELGTAMTADVAGSIIHFNGDEETILSQLPEKFRPGFLEFLVGEKDDEWYVKMMHQAIENGLVSFGFETAVAILKQVKIGKAIAKEISDDPTIQGQAVVEFMGNPSDYDEYIANSTVAGKVLDPEDFNEGVLASSMDSHLEPSQLVQERKLKKTKRQAQKRFEQRRGKAGKTSGSPLNKKKKFRNLRELHYEREVRAKDPYPDYVVDQGADRMKKAGTAPLDATPEEISKIAEDALNVDLKGADAQKLTWETSLKPELSRFERRLNTLDDLSLQVDNIKRMIKGYTKERDDLLKAIKSMDTSSTLYRHSKSRLDKLQRNLKIYPTRLAQAQKVRYTAIENIMKGDARFATDLVDNFKVKLEDLRRGLKASGLSEKEVTQILDNTSKNPARALQLINRAVESAEMSKTPAIKRLKKDMKKVEESLGIFSRDARERIKGLDPTKTPSVAQLFRSSTDLEKLKRSPKTDAMTNAELEKLVKDPQSSMHSMRVDFGLTQKQALLAGQQLKEMNFDVEMTFKKLLQDFQATTDNLTSLAKGIQAQGGVTKADKRMIHQYIANLAGVYQYTDIIYGTTAKDGLVSTYGRNIRQLGQNQADSTGRALNEQFLKFNDDMAKGKLENRTVLDYLTGTSKDAEANNAVGNLLVSLESAGSLQELQKSISKVADAKRGTSAKDLLKVMEVKEFADWFQAHQYASMLSGYKTLFGGITLGGTFNTVWINSVERIFEGIAQHSLKAAVQEPWIASKAVFDVLGRGLASVFDQSGRTLAEKGQAILDITGGSPRKSEFADAMYVKNPLTAWKGISETAQKYFDEGVYTQWALTRIMQPLMTFSAPAGTRIGNLIDFVDKLNRGAAFNASLAVDAYRQAQKLPPGMLAKGPGAVIEKYSKKVKQYQEIIESGRNADVQAAEITILTEGDTDLATKLAEAYKTATYDADRAVLQQTLDDTSLAFMHNAILNASQGSTGAKILKSIFWPFHTAPANILQNAIEYVPGFNYATGRMRNHLKNGTPDQKLNATAKIYMSMVFAATAYTMYERGMIRGNIPFHEKEAAEAKGHEANVLIFGDTQIKFERIGHVGTTLGIFADVFKAQDDATAEEGVWTAIGSSLSAMANSQTERSYMKSMKEVMAMVSGEARMTNVIDNRLSTTLNPVAGAQKSVIEFFSDNIKDEPKLDPEATDAITRYRARLDKIFQNNILWRNTVGEYQMQVDALGRPVQAYDSNLGAFAGHMMGYSVKTINNDPLINALAKHGLVDNSGTTTVEGITLTKKQYQTLQKKLWGVNNPIEEQIRDLVSSTGYLTSTTPQQERILRGALSRYKSFAKTLLTLEDPKLAIDIEAKRMAKIASEFGIFDTGDEYTEDGLHQRAVSKRKEDAFKRDYRESVYKEYGLD